MNANEYRKLRDRDVDGRQAITNRRIQTRGGLILAAGVTVTLRRKFGGFEIETPTCKTCGVKFVCTRVDYSSLDLINRPD